MNHWLTATLGNISVNRKLGLGFGLVLLLTLLITITGWKGLTSVIERGDKLANISQVIALITIDEPQGVYYGGTIAAPVVADIFQNILPYLGIKSESQKEVFAR